MRETTPLPVILAQDGSEDLRREAGLRGERFTTAVWGLSVVFAIGLAVLAFVVMRGRRRTP